MEEACIMVINPTRYFVEIYRAFTLESMYIPMHELDTYMMGRIFAHIYCNTDITKSKVHKFNFNTLYLIKK